MDYRASAMAVSVEPVPAIGLFAAVMGLLIVAPLLSKQVAKTLLARPGSKSNPFDGAGTVAGAG